MDPVRPSPAMPTAGPVRQPRADDLHLAAPRGGGCHAPRRKAGARARGREGSLGEPAVRSGGSVPGFLWGAIVCLFKLGFKEM